MKSWIEYINESLELPKIQWRQPTTKELREEFQEPDIDSLFFTGYPKKDEVDKAFQFFINNLTRIAIEPSKLNKSNAWRFIFKDYETFEKQVTSYFENKNPKKLINAIQNGEKIPMPVVIKKIDGSYLLAGGATRTAIANLANQKIEALVFDEKKVLRMKLDNKIQKKKDHYQTIKNDEVKKDILDLLDHHSNRSNLDKKFIKDLESKYTNKSDSFEIFHAGIGLVPILLLASKLKVKIDRRIISLDIFK